MVRLEDLPPEPELSDGEYEKMAMIEKHAEQRKKEGFAHIKNPFESIFKMTSKQFSETTVHDSNSKYIYKDDDEKDTINNINRPTHRSTYRRLDMSNTRKDILECDENYIYPYMKFDESNLNEYSSMVKHIPLNESNDDNCDDNNTLINKDEIHLINKTSTDALHQQHHIVNFLCNANSIDSLDYYHQKSINDSYFNHLSIEDSLKDLYSTILKYHFISIKNLYDKNLPKIGTIKITHNNQLYKCWLHGWQSSVSFEQEIKNRRMLSSPKLCIFVRNEITLEILSKNPSICRQPNTWIYAIWTIDNTYHVLHIEDVINYFIPFDMLIDETFKRLPNDNCCQIILHENDQHIVKYISDPIINENQPMDINCPKKIWYGIPILPPEYYTHMNINMHIRDEQEIEKKAKIEKVYHIFFFYSIFVKKINSQKKKYK